MMERAVDGERLSNGRRIEVDKKAPSIAILADVKSAKRGTPFYILKRLEVFKILSTNWQKRVTAGCNSYKNYDWSELLVQLRSVPTTLWFLVRNIFGHKQYGRGQRSAPRGTLLEGRRLVTDTYLTLNNENEIADLCPTSLLSYRKVLRVNKEGTR
ncbi:unnamed protein product [Enterobius vermicularis]|uniref:Reverse transcriptase n=1 Tax=Enterobius vermicularis TaxID=51028 RepID=A0A0N4V8G3_ENTVE|nr:unnamed protein product [Enterobius vermicularis]